MCSKSTIYDPIVYMNGDGLRTPPPSRSPRRTTMVMTRHGDRAATRFVYDQLMKIGPVIFPLFDAVGTGLARAGQALHESVQTLGNMIVGQPFDQRSVVEAIEKLTLTLEFIDKKLGTMRNKIGRCDKEARELCKAGDRNAALHQLRLKAMYSRECGKINTLRFNIESNILHMESVGVMMETVSTIKDTSAQFKIISQHVNISKLENSIEEMFEQNDACTSIEEVLTDLNSGVAIEDVDLQAELEQMMTDVGGDGFPPPVSPNAPLIPSVPLMPDAPCFLPVTNHPLARAGKGTAKGVAVLI